MRDLQLYTKTHSDRRCQLRKDMAQNIVRLDEGEEEQSEVTQEAQAEMGGGGGGIGRDARTEDG